MVYTFSNLTVTNITNIDNFKLNDYTNVIYLNNTINTDSNQNYNISSNNTNCTFIIGNINQPIYKKKYLKLLNSLIMFLLHLIII